MGYLTIIGGVFIAWLILVVLFAPHIPYHVEEPVDPRSDHFIHVLESTCNTALNQHNKIEILTNGTVFYPAMIDAIRSARETINMECYIFKKGEVADRFIDALCERAGAGVQITVVLDALGSFGIFGDVAKRPYGGTGWRGSTIVLTASCWWSMAGSRSLAAPACRTGGSSAPAANRCGAT
jgi:hypothetical protein